MRSVIQNPPTMFDRGRDHGQRAEHRAEIGVALRRSPESPPRPRSPRSRWSATSAACATAATRGESPPAPGTWPGGRRTVWVRRSMGGRYRGGERRRKPISQRKALPELECELADFWVCRSKVDREDRSMLYPAADPYGKCRMAGLRVRVIVPIVVALRYNGGCVLRRELSACSR